MKLNIGKKQKGLTVEQAAAEFEKERQKAEKLVAEPGKIEKLLKKLGRKLEKLPVLSGPLEYLPKMYYMVRSWLRKEYTGVPVGTIVSILGALLYFLSPVDLVPDFLPGIGYLDDAVVISVCLTLVKGDIDRYMEWKVEHGEKIIVEE